MKIHIFDQQSDLKISAPSIEGLCFFCLKKMQVSIDELSIFFVDSKKISQLHLQFFADPEETDCISFPIDSKEQSPCYLGDIFICPKVAIQYAKQHQICEFEECSRYLVHGILHLLGYDDIDETEHQQMHKLQEELILELKKRKKLLTIVDD